MSTDTRGEMRMDVIRRGLVLFFAVTLLFGVCLPKPVEGITVKEEEELAREVMKAVNQQLDLVKDPVVVDYLNTIAGKIVAKLPPQLFEYHFYVVREDVYNAFATPAGHVFINSGLFAVMESEEELAGILSHEIAHVAARHISQKIERSKKINIVSMAGVAAGLLLGAGGATAVGQAMTVSSMAAGQTLSLAYSREDETQADQLGLGYLSDTGYGGEGLLSILKKIRSKRWYDTDQVPTYLMTHPDIDSRLAYIDTWLATHDKIETPVERQRPYDFERARSWLIAMCGDTDTALRHFASALEKSPDNPSALYGYGLAMARSGHPKEAVKRLQAALKKRPLDTYIQKDLGRIYFLDGQYRTALNTLRNAVGGSFFHSESYFYLGRTLLELGMLDRAVVTFETIVKKDPEYTRAHYFLGEAYGKAGRVGEAHFQLGVYYQAREDFGNAIFHLKRALEKTEAPGRREKIEKMITDLEGRKREERHRS
jgi:beta-barrel assembly-enhancing protease